MLKVLKEANINNKIVLLRLDLNVPISQNKIVSNFRIIKSIPTIEHLIKNNNKIVILSHLGRPKEGEVDEKYICLKKLRKILFLRKIGLMV